MTIRYTDLSTDQSSNLPSPDDFFDAVSEKFRDLCRERGLRGWIATRCECRDSDHVTARFEIPGPAGAMRVLDPQWTLFAAEAILGPLVDALDAVYPGRDDMTDVTMIDPTEDGILITYLPGLAVVPGDNQEDDAASSHNKEAN